MGMKKLKSDEKAPKAPKKPAKAVGKVAEEITDLVETAERAEELEVENSDLKNDLHQAQKEAQENAEIAQGYAAEVSEVTLQDIVNLTELRADVRFRAKFNTGAPYVEIEGTGRRKIRAKAATFVEALQQVRALMHPKR